MNKKEIIVWSSAIVVIILLAYFVANFIHNSNKNNENEFFNTEEIIKIDGEEINFKTYRIDQSFFIKVPDKFIMVDEETLKSKYNYANRPELVFTVNDAINIFISTTDVDMTDENLGNYLDNRISGLTNMTVEEREIYQKYNKTFAKLVAFDNVDNSKYYNLRFFTIDNKLVTIEFNISKTDYIKWKLVIDEIMDSICFSEDDLEK